MRDAAKLVPQNLVFGCERKSTVVVPCGHFNGVEREAEALPFVEAAAQGATRSMPSLCRVIAVLAAVASLGQVQ
jgi:hypothetical protein